MKCIELVRNGDQAKAPTDFRNILIDTMEQQKKTETGHGPRERKMKIYNTDESKNTSTEERIAPTRSILIIYAMQR